MHTSSRLTISLLSAFSISVTHVSASAQSLYDLEIGLTTSSSIVDNSIVGYRERHSLEVTAFATSVGNLDRASLTSPDGIVHWTFDGGYNRNGDAVDFTSDTELLEYINTSPWLLNATILGVEYVYEIAFGANFVYDGIPIAVSNIDTSPGSTESIVSVRGISASELERDSFNFFSSAFRISQSNNPSESFTTPIDYHEPQIDHRLFSNVGPPTTSNDRIASTLTLNAGLGASGSLSEFIEVPSLVVSLPQNGPSWDISVGSSSRPSFYSTLIEIGTDIDYLAYDSDFDSNGVVDEVDYFTWRTSYGDGFLAGVGADANWDGSINAADYTIWRDQRTNTPNAVPEPTAVYLTISLLASAYCMRARSPGAKPAIEWRLFPLTYFHAECDIAR